MRSSALPSHDVSTVVSEGWSGIKNGKLLALDAVSNELRSLLPLLPKLEQALLELGQGSYVVIG